MIAGAHPPSGQGARLGPESTAQRAVNQQREAEVLAALAQTITASLEVGTVLQRVTDGARELCLSDGAAIALREPGAEVAVVRYWAGRPYQGLRGAWIAPGDGLGGLVLVTGRPCRTDDYAHDPRSSPAYRPLLPTARAVSLLVVPIRSGARVEGLLYVGATRPRTFTDHDEAILQRLAAQAAIALHNAQLYAAVQAGRAQLQALSRQLLEAQEAERRRLAHELHDEAGQLLAGVHLALDTAIHGLPPPVQEGFAGVYRQLDAVEAQLRRLAHELRPTLLDDLGLLPALQSLAQRVAARTGLGIRVYSALTERLAPAVETAVYRMMQEGLTNITRHAAATQVDLQLWRDGAGVHGRLRDDGVGFVVEAVLGHPEARGLGLLGMRERLEAVGGTLQITSAPGHGTTLQCTVPIAAGAGSPEAAGA
jgi:two-component system, NarL family, sensor histidine kinase DevS